MSYTNPSKAIELAHELADKLKIRFSTFTVTEAFDTDGNPYFTIDDGTPATTEMCIIVKVLPVDWALAKDVLGNTANIYSPHKIMLGTEDSASHADYITPQQLMHVIGEIVGKGTQWEWYKTANGTAPTLANTIFAAAKLKGTFYPDMYNPLTSQQ
jgi:hypothetical protein